MAHVMRDGYGDPIVFTHGVEIWGIPVKSIYLAGAIDGQPDAVVYDWRNEAEHLLTGANLRSVSPPGLGTAQSDERVVRGDLEELIRCDAVLLNAETPSFGTGAELLYAYQHHVRIVAFDGAHAKCRSAFVRHLADICCPTLDEAVRVLAALLASDGAAK